MFEVKELISDWVNVITIPIDLIIMVIGLPLCALIGVVIDVMKKIYDRNI